MAASQQQARQCPLPSTQSQASSPPSSTTVLHHKTIKQAPTTVSFNSTIKLYNLSLPHHHHHLQISTHNHNHPSSTVSPLSVSLCHSHHEAQTGLQLQQLQSEPPGLTQATKSARRASSLPREFTTTHKPITRCFQFLYRSPSSTSEASSLNPKLHREASYKAQPWVSSFAPTATQAEPVLSTSLSCRASRAAPVSSTTTNPNTHRQQLCYAAAAFVILRRSPTSRADPN